MNKPHVIAINSVSGGGKTALTKLLAKSLESAVALHFDDFEETNRYPDDFCEWRTRGADVEEFDCPGLQEALLKALSEESVRHIVVDYPFGREHHRLRDLIDLSVFIDTPLDLALVRRIQRDYLLDESTGAEERLDRLSDELSYYSNKSRPVYLDAIERKKMCELVLDGTKKLELNRDEVLRIL